MTRKLIIGMFQLGVLALIVSAMAACVWRTEHKIETVSRIDAHIILDIRQLKEEASQVENYVRGDDVDKVVTNGDVVPAGDAPAAGKPVSSLRHPYYLQPVAHRSWFGLLDPATAAQADEAAPAGDVEKAKEARRGRAKQIEEGLSKAQLGENDSGYLDLLTADKELRKPWHDVVRDENRDRKAIYDSMAQEKKSTLAAIEMIFAEIIREKLRPGQPFQAPRNREVFAAFLETALGRKYPEAKPGAWLVKK